MGFHLDLLFQECVHGELARENLFQSDARHPAVQFQFRQDCALGSISHLAIQLPPVQGQLEQQHR